MNLEVLNNIADIAGTDAEAFRGDAGCVCGDDGIFRCKHHVAELRRGNVFAARHFELSVPTVVICTENEHHFRLCNERLMITGFGKLILKGLIRPVNDGVRHAVAAGRCAHGSSEDNIFGFGCDLLLLKNTDGLAVHQNLNRFIHF